MTRTVTYKQQGDGSDSWIIEWKDDNGNNIYPPAIVYEEPKPRNQTAKNIDFTTLEPEQIAELKRILGL